MKVKSKREVTQLCMTLSDTVDCSLPGSSIHGIFQVRVLEWGAIAFSVFCGSLMIFSLEKEMAVHSSLLAWKIPWMEEPGRLQCTRSQRVGHT